MDDLPEKTLSQESQDKSQTFFRIDQHTIYKNKLKTYETPNLELKETWSCEKQHGLRTNHDRNSTKKT